MIIIYWLVVWNMFYFSILGMSSSQLTFMSFRGVGIPPTRYDSQWNLLSNWSYFVDILFPFCSCRENKIVKIVTRKPCTLCVPKQLIIRQKVITHTSSLEKNSALCISLIFFLQPRKMTKLVMAVDDWPFVSMVMASMAMLDYQRVMKLNKGLTLQSYWMVVI